MNWLRRTEITK